MIVAQDQEHLDKITGGNITREMIAEYENAVRQYHRCGGTGPIGWMGCWIVTRMAGFMLPAADKPQKITNWRDVKIGSIVEAMVDDENWVSGKFKGIISRGSVGVEFSDGRVREFQPVMVREMDEEENYYDIFVAEESDIDWSSIQKDTEVWVCEDGIAVQTGSFVSEINGVVKVKIAGKTKQFEASYVKPKELENAS